MKKFRVFPRWFLISAIFAVLPSFVGCGGSSQPPAPASTPAPVKVYRVGIATLMSHPALDAVQANLKTKLAEEGFVEGKNLEFVIRNANGDPNMAAQIARELDGENLDVVVPITTPMAQAMRKVTKKPLVFAAVTDPVGAGIVPNWTDAVPDVTGTSDAWPYRQQLELARKLFPTAKTIAVLYNPGEAASQYGIKQIREIAPGLGFELIEISVAKSGEVLAAARGVARKADILYLSSDNTVIGGAAGAAKAAFEVKKPLIVGDAGTVKKGGLAAVSVGYEGLGRETGRLVAEFLRGNRSIPVVIAHGDEIYLNEAVAKKIGFTFPEEIRSTAKEILTAIE